MAESHSIYFAYETLALVSKAIGRLEVGDIGIAKFDETVDTAFTFSQKATDVLVFGRCEPRNTRSSPGSGKPFYKLFIGRGDLWQLEIIISDGVCQNREKPELRVMMVFVVVDSLHSNAASSTAGLEANGKGATDCLNATACIRTWMDAESYKYG
jgi:midasin